MAQANIHKADIDIKVRDAAYNKNHYRFLVEGCRTPYRIYLMGII